MFRTGQSQSPRGSQSPTRSPGDYAGILGLKYLQFRDGKIVSPIMEYTWPLDGEGCAGICNDCKAPAPIWEHECGIWASTSASFVVPLNYNAIAVVLEAFGDAPEVILYTGGWRAPTAVVRYVIEGPYKVAGPTPDLSWGFQPQMVKDALLYFHNATPISWGEAIELVKEQRALVDYALGLPNNF